MSAALGPRVGIWGSLDVADFAKLLAPRIFEHELRRRLPHARVYPYAPLGAEQPTAMDGGSPATPLGSWTVARRQQLAAELDLIAVVGDVIHVHDELHRDAYPDADQELVTEIEPSRFFVDGLGAELEQQCPVVWHAVGVPDELDETASARVRDALASKRYVSVQDEISRTRLRATGTDREISLVPNSTLLAPRVFSGETLRKRLDYLRVIGAYPPDESPLLVSADAQASEQLETFAKAITRADPATPIVVVDLVRGRGSDELVRALASGVGKRVYRLPEEVTLEDIAAAMANARAFVGGSLDGYVAALGFGVPAVLVSPNDPPPFTEVLVVRDLVELPDALPALLTSERRVDEATLNALAGALDTHFDTLAAIAEESWSKRLSQEQSPNAATAELGRALAESERRYEALLKAYAARGEQLLVERMRFSELLDATEAEDSTATRVRALLDAADARNRLEIIDAERAVVRAERDEARAKLESVRAERDELRAQLAQARANHRPARVLRLLARRG